MSDPLPGLVRHAADRAAAAGFPHSCDPAVGRLLAVLAARVPPGGRILEIGTGAGVGTAWLASGLLPRRDATVTTIEADPGLAALAAGAGWPGFVGLRAGDALALLPTLGGFDLIFADAPAGKQERLDLTLAALNLCGTLVVDDMAEYPGSIWPADFRARQDAVRRALLTHPGLVAAELAHGSGVILAARRTHG
ncbi:O-methyltransferase [Thermoactinospora rubra]|uniref:O-methyltransferase n=1 Tax=Thermoactinospora rubra TaxID=1088767 RepID=UPI000A0FF26F|nr:class I SAM-dependent methyltransferase [Thermoactinospora rubra]